MSLTTLKLATKKKDLCLRAVKGHFATSHSHMNYYIDIPPVGSKKHRS